MDYARCAEHLAAFAESLPETGVRFVRFAVGAAPERGALRKWTVNGTRCYLGPDEARDSWCVYRESAVRRALARRVSEWGDCGNHVAFGIARGPGGAIVVQTHKAVYAEIPPEPGTGLTFSRDGSAACNFLFGETDSESFGKTKCYGKSALMEAEYSGDPFSIDIVQGLYRALGGGDEAAAVVGGDAPRCADPVAYKGVTFVSDAFVRFLSEKLFVPMRRLRDDLASAQVLFDEYNELGEGANRHVVVMYDFADDWRSLFYVHTAAALAAAYAAENPTVANAYERRCLQGFDRAVAHPVTGIAAAAARP